MGNSGMLTKQENTSSWQKSPMLGWGEIRVEIEPEHQRHERLKFREAHKRLEIYKINL